MLHFLNPALLLGALLFAVPLIIHLLNRQRYKRRPWAAMEFLLSAYKKQRKRLRAENLLLLLLRCLIPIAIAIAIARPTLRDSAVASLLGGACHHVVVLDGSYSMGLLVEGSATPWEKQKSMAGQLLERVEGRAGHKVSIAVAGVRPSWPVVDDLGVGRARATLAALAGPQDSAADLTETLAQVAELVEKASDPELRVYLFTDLQARAFGTIDKDKPEAPPVRAPADPKKLFADDARDLCERIQKKAELLMLDMAGVVDGGARADNLQISELALSATQPHAIAKVAVPVIATIENKAATGRSIPVTIEIDGGEPTRKAITLDAGASGQVEFPLTFRDTGLHRVRATLEGDALPADNERFLVVDVRERLRVLLVEGSTETESRLRDSTHAQDMLDPTRGKGSPIVTKFQTTVVDALTFLSRPPRASDQDLIMLCNVERLSEPAAAALRDALQAGVGVFVMLGDRCDVESYNLHLHQAGAGPMPVRLSAPLGFKPGSDDSYGFELATRDHPVFKDLEQDVYRDIFRMTPIWRFVKAEFSKADAEKLPEHVSVLARVLDPERSPLLIASRFHDGKMLLATSAISSVPERWNRLDDPWIALPLLHQIVVWLTLPSVDPYNLRVGAALTCSLPERPSNVTVVVSERAGSTKRPVGEEPKALPGGRFAMPAFRQTEFAGHYLAEMQLGKSGEARQTQLPFAVNVDPADGEPSYLSHALAKERLGVKRILRALPDEGHAALTSGSSELAPFLLHLALIFLLSEAALARFVSARRR